MNVLLNRLVVYLNTCLKKDVSYEIAQYIIENFSHCERISLQKLCDDCYVSRASITRFCKMFGYASWKEFHQYLVSTKQIRENQLLVRLKNVNIERIYHMLAHITGGQDVSFTHSLKKEMQVLVEMIHESNRIYVFGAMYPLSIVATFQMDMIAHGKIVYCDFQSQENQIEALHAGDVAIILTATGRYIGECKEKFNRIYQSPAKKIVFSSNDRYREMHNLDHYLYMPISDKGEIKDFDYYVMGIFDILYVEYYLQYIEGKAYVKS